MLSQETKDQIARLTQEALKASDGKRDIILREGHLIVGLDVAKHGSEQTVSNAVVQYPDGSIEFLSMDYIRKKK